MKQRFIFSALALSLVATLTACQSTSQTETEAHNNNSSMQEAQMMQTKAQLLQSYVWTYQTTNMPKPIILNFQDGRVGIDAGCNGMGTDIQVDDKVIKAGNVISTMKACEPSIMKQEQMAGKLFANRDVPYELDLANLNQPVLILTTADGQKLRFTGEPTAEMKYKGQAEIQFLEIAPETKACVGVAPMQCLQVREIKYDDKGIKTYAHKDWSLYYGQIEGFKHNPEQRVIVRVKRFEIKNPAADQPSQADVLDMLVEQELVKKP